MLLRTKIEFDILSHDISILSLWCVGCRCQLGSYNILLQRTQYLSLAKRRLKFMCHRLRHLEFASMQN
ncbi:hypothetical protein MPTK1_8g07670 [Marchantia polymorpha subsp. ruderalis]|uniref:Uncharacterized protein n=1 Tax=Marchantia polymorpha TaxID=3197 RepID=A0A2R6XI38_MARPO|nr:hypothetical protein MARPO_0013s0028 [Marchantia polymorpha]BBN19076.1 hypothetical protein Mp_8g07670 [Marchantia polymorpha subsp. ruderalis]|eukprot:PTQ45770.1 hypothetical protein MARPO_0013s0028 [Marchantia polymorpha]